MRYVPLAVLGLFVASFYTEPLPTTWTHETLSSCYMRERPWAKFLGPLAGIPKPEDARACWADRGGFQITDPDATFVVLKEWPR